MLAPRASDSTSRGWAYSRSIRSRTRRSTVRSRSRGDIAGRSATVRSCHACRRSGATGALRPRSRRSAPFGAAAGTESPAATLILGRTLRQGAGLPSTPRGAPMASNQTEGAILAGGCFWGMQDLIRKLPGVISTRVGYSGGDVPDATYRNHGTHAEAVEIVFDPKQLSYRDLLEFFFQVHDPTTKDRQGNDIGSSYRSAIFYTTDEQKRVAEETIADVDASGLWPGKVVTEVAAAGPFWEAEPEHQDYLLKYPDGYTCHFVRPGWKLARRSGSPA